MYIYDGTQAAHTTALPPLWVLLVEQQTAAQKNGEHFAVTPNGDKGGGVVKYIFTGTACVLTGGRPPPFRCY